MRFTSAMAVIAAGFAGVWVGCQPHPPQVEYRPPAEVSRKIYVNGEHYDTVILKPRLAGYFDACVQGQPVGNAAVKCRYWSNALRRCKVGRSLGHVGIAPQIEVFKHEWCRLAREGGEGDCPRGAVEHCDRSRQPPKCECRCIKGRVWSRRAKACISKASVLAEQRKKARLAQADLDEKRPKIEAGLLALSKRAKQEIRTGRCAADSVKLLRFLQKKMSPSSGSNYLFLKRLWLVAKPSGAKYTYRTGLSGVRRFIVVGFGPTRIKMKDGQGYAVQATVSKDWESDIWRPLLLADWIGDKTAKQLTADSYALRQWEAAIIDWARGFGGVRKAFVKMGGAAARWGRGNLADGRQVRTSPGQKLTVTVFGSGCAMFVVLMKRR